MVVCVWQVRMCVPVGAALGGAQPGTVAGTALNGWPATVKGYELGCALQTTLHCHWQPSASVGPDTILEDSPGLTLKH